MWRPVFGPAFFVPTPEKMTELMEIARVVASARDVHSILVEVCVRVARLCDGERGSVFFWDEETQEVIPIMSQLASAEPSEGSWRRCPNHRNPRDVARSGAGLQFAVAHGLVVENTDAGVSFLVDSD